MLLKLFNYLESGNSRFPHKMGIFCKKFYNIAPWPPRTFTNVNSNRKTNKIFNEMLLYVWESHDFISSSFKIPTLMRAFKHHSHCINTWGTSDAEEPKDCYCSIGQFMGSGIDEQRYLISWPLQLLKESF